MTSGRERLKVLRGEIGDCRRCARHAGRTQVVFGYGPAPAVIMFVGEAPGSTDDKVGEPFAGDQGAVLSRILTWMKVTRDRVYLAHVVMCHEPTENQSSLGQGWQNKSDPPRTRKPSVASIAACLPFLHAQIAAVQPAVVVALGLTVARVLLGDRHLRLGDVRGRWHEVAIGETTVRVMPTHSPGELLRARSETIKRQTRWDLERVLDEVSSCKYQLTGQAIPGATGGGDIAS